MHMLHVTHLLHILYWTKIWTPAYYMPTDEFNEFLKIYLDNVKGVDLDMKSLTEEFNLFTVYIVFRKFQVENC